MAGVKNWLYDIINPDPQKETHEARQTRALMDVAINARDNPDIVGALDDVVGSYEPSVPREPAPEFKIDATYQPPVTGSGVRAPRTVDPQIDRLERNPEYQRFVREKEQRAAQAPVVATPPIAAPPVAAAPPPVDSPPIRMFTSRARDVSAGPTPDVPTYTNVGTRGDVVDLGAQQNVGGPADNSIDSEAYRNYLRNSGRLGEFEQEQAGIAESGARRARAETLTANPFEVEDRAQERVYEQAATRAMFGEQQDTAKMRNQAGLRREQLAQLSALETERLAEHEKIKALGAQQGLTPEQIQVSHDNLDEDYNNRRLGLDLPTDVRREASART